MAYIKILANYLLFTIVYECSMYYICYQQRNIKQQQMKKPIQRNLPLADKYQLLAINRQGIEGGNAFCCDNCNKVIVNYANIANSAGKRFTVGLDCMKTLTSSLINFSDYDLELFTFNSVLRFYTQYKKATKVTDDGFYIRIEYTDTKGNVKQAGEFKSLMVKYNFAL